MTVVLSLEGEACLQSILSYGVKKGSGTLREVLCSLVAGQLMLSPVRFFSP
jgi:hypothetical protein